jgi:hypothetical protein
MIVAGRLCLVPDGHDAACIMLFSKTHIIGGLGLV